MHGRKYNQFKEKHAINNIQSNDELGGLEIAVADLPAGPFINHTSKTLVDKFIHGAQPIDAHLFKDDDGTIYLYYGGWRALQRGHHERYHGRFHPP